MNKMEARTLTILEYYLLRDGRPDLSVFKHYLAYEGIYLSPDELAKVEEYLEQF